jgi:hypothetical protein
MRVKFVTIPLVGTLFIVMLDMLSVKETLNIFATLRSNVKAPLEEDAVAFSSRENVATPAAVMSAMA